MKSDRYFPSTPESAGMASHFVLEALPGVPREVGDAIELMVSELATNAIKYAETPFRVGVDQTFDRISVEVTDSGGGRPVRRVPPPGTTSSLGLNIVASLSDSWGVKATGTVPGKTVWFSVAAPTAPLSGPG